MKSQKYAMTTATKLATCTLLIAVALAIALLFTSRAYAQQNCTQVKMIFAEAWNTLYLIDGDGNRLVDIENGNDLSNRQINSFIVLRGIPSSIGIEIEGTGETIYRYKNNIVEPGDRGYEDYTDDDFNDAVILLTPIDCPGAVAPPQPAPTPTPTPREPNPPPAAREGAVPSIQSVSADDITKTTARAVVDIADHDGTELTVKLRYQKKAELQDWTTNVRTVEVTGSTSPATKDLESLTPGTAYALQASFDDTFPDDATKEYTFTTERQPSIQSVSVSNIGLTSARATINIANSDGSTQIAKLQYRSTNPQGQWSKPPFEENSTVATAVIDLNGLTSGTGYELQAWLATDEADKETATFRTSQAQQQKSQVVPTPSVSSVTFINIMQTSAVTNVILRNAGTAQKTVRLRYRAGGNTAWSTPAKTSMTKSSGTAISLTSLTAGTTYEAQVWLTSSSPPSGTKTYTFDTLVAPSISDLEFENIELTSADATVNIADAGTSQKTVRLHYRVEGTTTWSTPAKFKKTSGSSATISLTGLTAGTTYEVQAWLNSSSPPSGTKTYTFDTLVAPSISDFEFENIELTSADATVKIADAGTSQKTVRLHYRVEGTTTWSTPAKFKKTSGSSATISLTGLTAGTTYEVQAWLNSSSPPSGTKTYTFDTLVAPSISDLEFENIEQTSGTTIVEIADAGTDMKQVYLKHSVRGEDDWTAPPYPTITYGNDTSIKLRDLTANTTYEVAVAMSDDFNDMLMKSFTTLPPPSLSGVGIGNVTETSAVATMSIANAGTGQKTVLLQYRKFGESIWGVAESKTVGGSSTTFNLTGLEPRTAYEVKAYLDAAPDAPKYAVFTTLSPNTSVSRISVGSITQTTAVATVNIAYPGTAQKTVHLRYREFGEREWASTEPKTPEGVRVSFDLPGLTPETKYEVEASLANDFSGAKSATFTTLALASVVSGISVDSRKQTSARAIIKIANSDGTSRIVHLRYRTTTPQSEWSDTQETTSSTATASIELTGLTADTEYEVEASLDADFGRAVSETFTTLRYPSISKLEVEDDTKNSATAVITIADPDSTSQTIHLRYRTTTPQGTWSSTQKTTSSTATASIGLSGLTADTEYEVEVSLTADFAVTVSDTFRTLPPDPVVAEVSVNNIRQTTTTAYIDIANANGSTQKVSLRYRTTTPRGAWSGIKTTTSTTASASIDLSGLTPGTEYDVQASLDNSFPATRTKLATFTTLRWPSIASFEAENVGRNGATVSATIADSRGMAQTVYVRHRATGYIAWRPTQQMDSVDDIARLRLRGLSSGTEYVAEASLGSSFPEGETRSVTFTTRSREKDSGSSSGVVAQAARAVNIPLLGFSPQMLRFTAIEGGDNPAPQVFLVWNRAQGAMSFTLSNQRQWLSQQPTSGVSNGPDDQVTITASVDSSALASGQYVDIISIDVSSSGKSPAQVIVVLDVLLPDYIRQFVSRDEGGVVVLPDGTVKLIAQPLSPPKDVDIELMKVNLQAHGQPPGEQERVVVAIESNTYEPGGDTPEDVAYAPYVELWVQLPQEDAAACDEGKTRVYSVEAETWNLVEHRCETDESDKVWAVTQVERLGQFALVIDDAPVSPTPTPVAAALATPTNSVIKAPAPAIVRISLPAQPPTPTPISVPTPVLVPNEKTTVAPTIMPTPTAVPVDNEPSAPPMQATAGDGNSGGFGKIILAALGVPMLIGTLIVVYLLRRERLRREAAGL